MSLMKELKERVWKCNIDLYEQGLVKETFGNVSGIDRESGIIAIKPSGIPYKELQPDDIVLVDLDNNIVEGKLNPSSDTKTHIVLYKAFPKIGGVAHTHSTFATAWAQAKLPIPCLGTTHADYVQVDIPCTGDLSKEQIDSDYESETGNIIVETLKSVSPSDIKMILVAGHAPFTWGVNPEETLKNTIILEEIAKLAYLTIKINPLVTNLSDDLLNKHYLRKHGNEAYYGQRKKIKFGDKNV
jgi:L-ribulose-5-phosphate 4-epimerase